LPLHAKPDIRVQLTFSVAAERKTCSKIQFRVPALRPRRRVRNEKPAGWNSYRTRAGRPETMGRSWRTLFCCACCTSPFPGLWPGLLLLGSGRPELCARIPVRTFILVASFVRLFRTRLSFMFLFSQPSKTTVQPFPQAAVVDQTQQFCPMHCVEPLKQWALKQIFIFHRGTPRPVWLSGSHCWRQI